jgi:uncharacterized protein
LGVLITPHELELHKIVVSRTYGADEIDYRGAEFRQLGALEVSAVAELEDSRIRVRGHLGGHLEANCDRCLCRVEIPVDRDFDLFYRPIRDLARAEEIEIPRDELEVGFYSGEGVPLIDLVTEQVILARPMKVVCGPDCRGLCAVCGANLNLGDCHCATPQLESPFSSLK